MNAACVSYCDMTSMDSYYSTSTAQGRDHQFRIFPTAETKYGPTFIPGKEQPYAEKSRSPFQQECQSLDGAEASTFNKYQLFMQRPTCKTPPEGSKLHSDSGLNGTLVSCYGECRQDRSETRKEEVCQQRGKRALRAFTQRLQLGEEIRERRENLFDLSPNAYVIFAKVSRKCTSL